MQERWSVDRLDWVKNVPWFKSLNEDSIAEIISERASSDDFDQGLFEGGFDFLELQSKLTNEKVMVLQCFCFGPNEKALALQWFCFGSNETALVLPWFCLGPNKKAKVLH